MCPKSVNGIINREISCALHEKPRPGAPGNTHGRFEATLTALAGSSPPEGYARWSLSGCLRINWLNWSGLIIFLNTRVGELLERNGLKPWQKKQWCLGGLSPEFLWRRENILDWYERLDDPHVPEFVLMNGRVSRLAIVSPLADRSRQTHARR